MGNMSSPIIFFAIVIGILSCFFGLKMRRLVFAIAFFIIGFSLTRYLAPAINNAGLLLTLRIIIGFIFAIISFSVERIVVFLYMFVTGFQMIQTFFNIDIWYYLLLAIATGLILALLSLKIFKLLIILSTAIYGAILLSIIVIGYVPTLSSYQFVVIAILTALGTIFQFSTNQNMTMNGKIGLY